ncbi:MAG: hypothetical protein ACLQBK_09435 [Candidatus Sulfotelmatobacter sp.]
MKVTTNAGTRPKILFGHRWKVVLSFASIRCGEEHTPYDNIV